jgi:hypothetical protein
LDNPSSPNVADSGYKLAITGGQRARQELNFSESEFCNHLNGQSPVLAKPCQFISVPQIAEKHEDRCNPEMDGKKRCDGLPLREFVTFLFANVLQKSIW